MVIGCPKCGKHVLDTAEDGTARLRAKVVLFTPEGTVAHCPSCKTPVKVPLVIHGEHTKGPLVHYIPGNSRP